MLRRTTIAVALLAMLAPAAHADWPAGGKFVSSPGDVNGVRNARIMELPSGDLVVFGMGVGGNNYTYNIQRLTHGGSVSPGWPSNGVALSSVLKGTPLRAQSIVVDDMERVWHSFPGNGGFSALESIDADGIRVPLAIPFNVGSTNVVVHAVPAPGGQVFVTPGSSRIKRIDSAGVTASGWPTNGVALPGYQFDGHDVLSDGAGGVVVFMRQSATTGLPIATRLDENGATHAGWPGAGLPISDVPPGQNIYPSSCQLLPSGTSHALAVWPLDAGSGTTRLIMQRFGLDGSLDPAWPAGGLEVVAADTIVACRAIADGSGGAFVVRQSHGRPVGTHITSAGAVLGAADTDLLDAEALYIQTWHPVLSQVEDLIADVTSDGNLLVGWNDGRLAPTVSFRLRWLTPTLAPAPDKPTEGLVFVPGSPHPYNGTMLALHADGPSGAFMAWGDYHDIGFGQVTGDIWMAYAQAPTTTSVGSLSPRALRLSAPRPNPALGSVVLDLVLPDDSPARVELLDVAGRVLRTQLVEGAGPHAITFDELGALAPGLYFARVTSRDRSAAVRVAVSR